jgi:hypothetical protein
MPSISTGEVGVRPHLDLACTQPLTRTSKLEKVKKKEQNKKEKKANTFSRSNSPGLRWGLPGLLGSSTESPTICMHLGPAHTRPDNNVPACSIHLG